MEARKMFPNCAPGAREQKAVGVARSDGVDNPADTELTYPSSCSVSL